MIIYRYIELTKKSTLTEIPTDPIDSFGNKCLAPLKNSPDKICSRKTKNGTDFCGYHIKTREYNQDALKIIRNKDIKLRKINKKFLSDIHLDNMIETLKTKIITNTELVNTKYNYALMDIKENWNDIPVCHRIELSDGWWDIIILTTHFSSQLNQSNMENPYPVFPSSPFTRKLYTLDDIAKIRERLIGLKMKINIALKIFINCDVAKIREFYNEALNDPNTFSNQLLQYMRSNLRYRLMNSLNSQSHFTGFWIRDNKTRDDFERLYDTYSKMSPEIYDYFTGQYIRNYDRDCVYTILITSKCSKWGPCNDFTQEFI